MIPDRPRTLITVLLIACLSLWVLPKEESLRAMPHVERVVLPNQLVLLVSEEHSLPLVTFQILVESGSRKDPPGQEGLANLTAQGLLLGTSTYSVTEFREALDFMGASLSVSAARDFVTLRLRVLKKDLDKGFNLLMEALTRPTFQEEELQRQVEKTIAALQSAEERPGEVAQKAFQRALYLNGPFRHPVEGTPDSLPQIKREAVLQFHRTYYHPNNAILAVVGDITLEEVKATLIPQLAQWPMAGIPKERFSAPFAAGPKTVAIDRNITQANIILGHKGISRKDPDYYALTVMNYILGGGGFGSRIFERIRVNRGLAYRVFSYLDLGKDAGAFKIVLQTKNVSAQEAVSLLRQEMERIQSELVLEEELDKARKYLVGNFPLRLDTQTKLVSFLTLMEYYGLGLDYPEKYPSYINGITREDVLRVAKSYLHPRNAILVVVGNLEEAGIAEATE
jgi:zinc protease